MKYNKYFCLIKLVIGLLLFINTISICQTSGIKGRLVFESKSAIPYEIYGLSISVDIESSLTYWDSTHIMRENKIYTSKEFLGDDGFYYELFDSLSQGVYTITHLSKFNDSYSYEIALTADTIIGYPKQKLAYETKELESTDYEFIAGSDSLQLLIIRLECYSFGSKLWQLRKLKQKKQALAENSNILELSKRRYKKGLLGLMNTINQKPDCYIDHTCNEVYSIKLNDMIYVSYDCCRSEELISKLKK